MFSQALSLSSPGLPTANLCALAVAKAEAAETCTGYAFGRVYLPQPWLLWLEKRALAVRVAPACLQPAYLARGDRTFLSALRLIYYSEPGQRPSSLCLSFLISESNNKNNVSLFHKGHCAFYNSPFTCGLLFNPITTCEVGDNTTGKVRLQPRSGPQVHNYCPTP